MSLVDRRQDREPPDDDRRKLPRNVGHYDDIMMPEGNQAEQEEQQNETENLPGGRVSIFSRRQRGRPMPQLDLANDNAFNAQNNNAGNFLRQNRPALLLARAQWLLAENQPEEPQEPPEDNKE